MLNSHYYPRSIAIFRLRACEVYRGRLGSLSVRAGFLVLKFIIGWWGRILNGKSCLAVTCTAFYRQIVSGWKKELMRRESEDLGLTYPFHKKMVSPSSVEERSRYVHLPDTVTLMQLVQSPQILLPRHRRPVYPDHRRQRIDLPMPLWKNPHGQIQRH